jgi:hypothetical protein
MAELYSGFLLGLVFTTPPLELSIKNLPNLMGKSFTPCKVTIGRPLPHAAQTRVVLATFARISRRDGGLEAAAGEPLPFGSTFQNSGA